MFYRPKFCCGCGEKIERTDWKPWSSTRFCDLCSTDHQLIEIVPKLLAGVVLLVGALGVGSLIKSQPAPTPVPNKRSIAAQGNLPAADANLKTTEPVSNQSQTGSPVANASVSKNIVEAANHRAEPQAAVGPVYFCGAQTKKGTPCTRKVKGNVRCWQHQGMPAMLPPDKLLISK